MFCVVKSLLEVWFGSGECWSECLVDQPALFEFVFVICTCAQTAEWWLVFIFLEGFYLFLW